LPETVVPVPTAVPPLVHVVGAVVWGPKTVQEIVPVGLEPLASAELIAVVAMAVPIVPEAGPVAVSVGENWGTTVSVMPEPQVLAAALLLASPA
jgi:hypothetical protein